MYRNVVKIHFGNALYCPENSTFDLQIWLTDSSYNSVKWSFGLPLSQNILKKKKKKNNKKISCSE